MYASQLVLPCEGSCANISQALDIHIFSDAMLMCTYYFPRQWKPHLVVSHSFVPCISGWFKLSSCVSFGLISVVSFIFFSGLSRLWRLSRSNAASGRSTVWLFFCRCWTCKYIPVGISWTCKYIPVGIAVNRDTAQVWLPAYFTSRKKLQSNWNFTQKSILEGLDQKSQLSLLTC